MFAKNFLKGIKLQSSNYIGKYSVMTLDTKSFLYKSNKIVIPNTTLTEAAANGLLSASPLGIVVIL